MRVEVRDTLGDLADQWDALVESRPIPSPFLRSWWTAKAARGRPRHVLALEGDALVGGLALEEDRIAGVRRLRTLGFALGSDHVGLVAVRGREEEAARTVGNWTRSLGACVIDLVGLAEDPHLAAALPGRVTLSTEDSAPCASLEGSFAEFLARKSTNFRRNTAMRARRKLEGHGARYRVLEPSEIEEGLVTMRRLHEMSVGSGSFLLGEYEHFAAVVRAGVRCGEAVFHQITVAGEPIATMVTYELAGRMSIHQSGRDPDSRWSASGHAMMGYLFERACERGYREVDLLRGGESYKARWATGARDVTRLRSAHGWRARLVGPLIPRAFVARRQLGARVLPPRRHPGASSRRGSSGA